MHKKQLIAACAGLALGCLMLASCGFNYAWFLNAGSAGAEEMPREPAIEARVNQDFVITLESNRTTGYEWQLAQSPDKNMLALVESEYQAPQNNLAGAGGKEVWTFKALAAGEARIFFKYIRPWEKDTPPAQERSFTVIIR
jgi:inhibitor of cysteine peptidase